MNNQTINPLEQGMIAKEESVSIKEAVNSKVQDTKAENVLSIVASIIIWFGSIVSAIAFFVGLIILLSNMDRWGDDDKRILGLIIMGASIISYLPTLISWASLKLMINVSRNLFVIKETITELASKMTQAKAIIEGKTK